MLWRPWCGPNCKGTAIHLHQHYLCGKCRWNNVCLYVYVLGVRFQLLHSKVKSQCFGIKRTKVRCHSRRAEIIQALRISKMSLSVYVCMWAILGGLLYSSNIWCGMSHITLKSLLHQRHSGLCCSHEHGAAVIIRYFVHTLTLGTGYSSHFTSFWNVSKIHISF